LPDDAPYFAALNEDLSQGDIVRGVPWGLIDSPLSVCREEKAKQKEKEGVQGRAARFGTAGEFGAGFFKGPETIHARGDRDLAMVLWHDCEIDKFKNQGRDPQKAYAAIAPIKPFHLLPEAQHDAVRRGERLLYFHVPAFDDEGIPESFVDVRHVWSVKQSLLADRVVGVSDHVKRGMLEHLFTFLTHTRLAATVHCPHCGGEVDTREVVSEASE
jgi:hypothetical protein